jgi:hypothetical protein
MRHADGRMVMRYTPGSSIASAATMPLNSANAPFGPVPSSAWRNAKWPASRSLNGVVPMPTVTGRPITVEKSSATPSRAVSPCS